MKETVGVKAIEMRLLGLHDQETAKGRFVKVLLQALPGEIESLRGLVGKRFGVAMALIGDDEKPVIQEEPLSDPDLRALKAKRHLIKLGQMHRNDPPYQAVLMEYFQKVPGYEWINNDGYNKVDPSDRRNIVARIQHQFCQVESLADIQPNTIEALRLQMLEVLFETDKAGLPPPSMEDPSSFKQIALQYGG